MDSSFMHKSLTYSFSHVTFAAWGAPVNNAQPYMQLGVNLRECSFMITITVLNCKKSPRPGGGVGRAARHVSCTAIQRVPDKPRPVGDNMDRKLSAIFYSLLAAGLYAINIPLSKLLLNYIEPTMMASYLYLGAGIGIGIVFLATRTKAHETSETITVKDMPYAAGMILLDILAPVFLMFGLRDTASSNASLLNNFEIVCTSVIALFVFKEAVSKRMWISIFLITISSFFLSLEDIAVFKFSWGAIPVLLATLCWGMENNCTRKLSDKNTYQIVFLKGIFSGLGSLVIATCLKERLAELRYIALAMLLGFVAYGLSIFFYIKAQGIIGASKTSAFYSIAPFIGTSLSFMIFHEKPNWAYFAGLGIMILGTAIVVIDTLSKTHDHTHKHTVKHTHDGSTHSHTVYHSHAHNHYISDKNHRHYHNVTGHQI